MSAQGSESPYDPEAEDAPYDPGAVDDAPYDPEAAESDDDAPYDPAASDNGADMAAQDSDSDSDVDVVLGGSGQAPPQAFQRIPMRPTQPAAQQATGTAQAAAGQTATAGTAAAGAPGTRDGPIPPVNLRSSAIISIAKPSDTPKPPPSATDPIYPPPVVSRPALPIQRTDGTGEPDAPPGTEQMEPPDFDSVGKYNGRDIYDVELDEIHDKAWRRPGAVTSDFFNYGFDERSWKRYTQHRRQMRSVNSIEIDDAYDGSPDVGLD